MTYHDGQRWTATASELVTEAILAQADNEKFLTRFWAKVDTRGEDWIWTAALSDEGYGNVSIRHNGREFTVRAHRVAYFLTYGAIDEALFLDHKWWVCMGRFCCNPDHLEPVTCLENTRRGQGVGRAMQRAARDKETERRNKEWVVY